MRDGASTPPAMPEVAIVGGGLCGLALAHSLQARGVTWTLFEARERLGGRVLTETSAQGLALDLGPTWYWPATQPSMAGLVQALGLATLAQADDGRVLLLDDPNREAQTVAVGLDGRDGETGGPDAAAPRGGALHGGARRVVGGMAALTEALRARLPAARLRTGRALEALHHAGDHVELQLRSSGGLPQVFSARRVVLALPPRVAADTVAFAPGLSPEVAAALRGTPTWMATAAKSATAYASAFWRDAGHTGNAWVTHRQAVLAEVFDATPPPGQPGAALAGFVALGVAGRQQFRVGLPMLIESQLAMLFGAQAQEGEAHLHDWAGERWTCTEQDRAEDGIAAHPTYGDARLSMPQWDGRLLFGGSETARSGGGYLEGALNAAARLRRQIAESLTTDARALPR